MNKPRVSVVINTYNNRPDQLLAAVKSYMTQPGVAVQVIVSTLLGDSSLSALNGIGVTFCLSKKPGIYSQLNKALSYVIGDWFCYASGNDVAVPGKLLDEVRCCETAKAHVCYSAFFSADAHLANKKVASFYPYSYEKHKKGNFVSDCAMMNREILNTYKPFVEKYGNAAYWDFWLRVAEGEGEAAFVYNPKPTWIYRTGGRHILRKKDKDKVRHNNEVKQLMLLDHRK